MQIKISSNKLTVLKSSFNVIEETAFQKPDFGLGSIAGLLTVKETQYTFEIGGFKNNLFDLLYNLSLHYDIDLI